VIELADLAAQSIRYEWMDVDVGQETEQYASETEAIEHVEYRRAAGVIGARCNAAPPGA